MSNVIKCLYRLVVADILLFFFVNLVLRRQNGKSQNGGYKKTKHAKFSENKHVLRPDSHLHMCVIKV